jgi:hypothetical protein
MQRIEFCWPQGKSGALTTSWDDGTEHDRHLVDILNNAGCKGTWNLGNASLGKTTAMGAWRNYISSSEIQGLFAGHEVAVHGVNHPFLPSLPDDIIRSEFLENRSFLEDLVGYPVRGCALPYGESNERVRTIARSCGLEYLRPVTAHQNFFIPADFLDWTTTCHHAENLSALWELFCTCSRRDKLMFIWGHSYEFHDTDSWSLIEAFAKKAGADSTVWQATNIEIVDYISAWRALRFSMNCSLVQNLSHYRIWLYANRKQMVVEPGATLLLN